MSEAPELLPCPFCGGEPYLTNVDMAGCSYVVCTDCRMQSDDGAQERVRAAWNTRADLPATDEQALANPKVQALVEALGDLHHAVCGETGFAECVRQNSGLAYPWPALDISDSKARAALAALGKEPTT